ncbi:MULTISPECIES: hypothetical protein [unclassified Sphingomonas]|jgi:hypothetical protein|uniref:hypothetical protein n=1 Tax=unclassified Sphingomonas TaxID=196159 RepID=UPI00083220C2|nr:MULTISPECIES: hypothetical protein [unclassified Sphingomonas]
MTDDCDPGVDRRRVRIDAWTRAGFVPMLRFYLDDGSTAGVADRLAPELLHFLIGPADAPLSGVNFVDRSGRLVAFMAELLDGPGKDAGPDDRLSALFDLIDDCADGLPGGIMPVA